VKSQNNIQSLLRLLPYAKPYWLQFVLVFLLVVIFNATSVLQPYLVKVAIDNDIAISHPDLKGLLMIGGVYIGIVIIGVFSNIFQMLLLQYTGQKIIRKIRIDLFSHIEHQGMDFFDKNAIGRLVTNISSDTETVSQFFTQFFLSMIRDGLSIIMIVIVMFELDVRIAWMCMIVIPIIFVISMLFRDWLRDAYQSTRTKLSNIVAFLAENLAGMRIIQIFHQEQQQADHFESLNTLHRKANINEYGISVLFNRVLELIGNLAVAAVVFIGGSAVLHHVILFGTLYAFISYIRQFFQPINAITQQWNTLQSSMVAADRIGKVLMVKSKIQNPPEAISIVNVKGKIEFRQVDFGYHQDELILKNVSFVIEPGQFVGFVGATGAGKSTIMSLLTRQYDPVAGEILLDDVGIQQLSLADLHRYIGMVQQDLQLFTGTISDNIRLFRPDISDETIQHATKAVGVHRIIDRLPNHYQTWLYAKGANISMGERQLLSFARMIALDPRVLILDEATASLDSQTEEMVQTGLHKLTATRTTMVIAHRLSTVRHADVIFVLDHGQIIEKGTHEELIQKNGLYTRLHENAG
jgi:ATP-binding cassette subfamily B protein